MQILFRKDNRELFDKLLKKYIEENISSVFYTPFFLEYIRFYITNLSSEMSFILEQNKNPVAVAFLPIEKLEDGLSISSGDSYIPAPLFINEKFEKETFNLIDSIAVEHKVTKIKFFLDPLIMEHQNKFNILRKYNYVDSSASDTILELNSDEKTLWRNMSENHRRNISKVLKDNDFEVVKIDHMNPDYDMHEYYRHLHHKCSGKITRSKTTFDIQFEMLKNDNASIFGTRYKGKMISFCYFFHYKESATYASGSDDPDFAKLPLYHVLLWSAALYYKKRNFKYLEFEEPCGYGVQFDDYIDKKQLNISNFKRGFGGKMVPIFKGIKYFKKEIFEKDIERFRNMWLQGI